jgi:SAM-dependent methyltransferase
MPYSQSAHIYDACYRAIGKDYKTESERIHQLIQSYKKSDGNSLLDVACGTGLHLEYLKDWYQVQGTDLEEEMLELARKRLPDVTFQNADFRDFAFDSNFDAVTCLFSSIGYAHTLEELQSAVGSMAKHLIPGGVLIIEPWFSPDQWRDGHLHAIFVDEPDLKICRMNLAGREGILAVMNMNYEVGTPDGIYHFEEIHKMALYTNEEYLAAFRSNGLDVSYDEEGLMGRGLYIGVKS